MATIRALKGLKNFESMEEETETEIITYTREGDFIELVSLQFQVATIYEGALDEETQFKDYEKAWDYFEKLERELKGQSATIYLEELYFSGTIKISEHEDTEEALDIIDWMDVNTENIETINLGD